MWVGFCYLVCVCVCVILVVLSRSMMDADGPFIICVVQHYNFINGEDMKLYKQ